MQSHRVALLMCRAGRAATAAAAQAVVPVRHCSATSKSATAAASVACGNVVERLNMGSISSSVATLGFTSQQQQYHHHHQQQQHKQHYTSSFTAMAAAVVAACSAGAAVAAAGSSDGSADVYVAFAQVCVQCVQLTCAVACFVLLVTVRQRSQLSECARRSPWRVSSTH